MAPGGLSIWTLQRIQIHNKQLCVQKFQVPHKNQCLATGLITSPNESNIQNASSLLKHYNVSETCQSELLSFLCLHLLGLCDSTGSLVQPTADQCRDIRDEICFTEWDILSAAGVDLPQCSNFPNSSCLSKKPGESYHSC